MIQLISSQEAIELRSRILRPGQDISLCHYNEDNLSTTFHIGYFLNNQIVSNGTFIAENHILFPECKNAYRLRGMATDIQFQKQGLGKKIILHAENLLIQKKCDLLWFNARISAEGFYQKLNFNKIGTLFNIDLIGPHQVMFKKYDILL